MAISVLLLLLLLLIISSYSIKLNIFLLGFIDSEKNHVNHVFTTLRTITSVEIKHLILFIWLFVFIH